jgi:hypothetical protein
MPMSRYRITEVSVSFTHQSWRAFFILNRPYSDDHVPLWISVNFDDNANVTNINKGPSSD